VLQINIGEGGKDKMKKLWLFLISAYLVVLAVPAISQAEEKTIYKVSGANLFADVFEKFSEGFLNSNTSCKPVMMGSSTGKGISEFLNGETVLVMASRAMDSKEKEIASSKGIQLSEKPVGKTSLAVVTNAKNPVEELSMEQLRKIFAGEIVNWKDVGGPDETIRVTIRAVPETGAGVLFQQVVLKGAPYAPNAQVMGSYGTTLLVAEKSMTIGYVPTASGYYTRMSNGVKELRIRLDESPQPVSAPVGLVRDTSFPISIPLVLIWNEKSLAPCMSNFVDFVDKAITGADSRKVASPSGSAPLARSDK
jgi:phosphate transport system substrate-binding protein